MPWPAWSSTTVLCLLGGWRHRPVRTPPPPLSSTGVGSCELSSQVTWTEILPIIAWTIGVSLCAQPKNEFLI
jgi:hypothetical protein